MKKSDTTIKCNVKQYRMANGWSQQQLADMTNVRRQAIYDIENERYMPNTAISLRLAKLFGCRVEDLFSEDESENLQRVDLINGENSPNSPNNVPGCSSVPTSGRATVPVARKYNLSAGSPARNTTSPAFIL